MIPKLLSKSNSKEVLSCVNNCLTEVENTAITENLHFKAMCSELRKEEGSLSDATGVIRKHELSDTLQKDDDCRDDLVTGIFYCLKGFTYSEDSVIKKNATIIYDLFRSHGDNITKQSYAVETAILNSFLTKIYTPEYIAMVETVPGMKAFFSNLKARNERFETTYQENLRNLALDDKPVIPASKQRKIVRDILNNVFIPYVEVMSNALPEEFSGLASVVTKAVEQINAKVRARLSKQKAARKLV